MTHRHAFRRGTVARPGERDLRELRRLVRRAAWVGADPLINARPFVIAAEKAGKAILPPAYRGNDSCFVQLIRLGKRFLLINAVDRIGYGPEILTLVAACSDALDADPTAGVAGGSGQGRLPYCED